MSKYRVQVAVIDEWGRRKASYTVVGYEWEADERDNAEWFADYLVREATAYVNGEETRL